MSSIELYKDSDALPPNITREALDKEVHFVDETGVVYRGIDAIAQILLRNTAWRWLARALQVAPLRACAKVLYRFIARHRHLVH